ncbi:MAG: hypothetical protein AAF459_05040, partial [Pseudomonadota bacterium]
GVLLFEATLGLDQSDPDCAQVTTPSAGCKLGDQLTFGVDYVRRLFLFSVAVYLSILPFSLFRNWDLLFSCALSF